MSERGAGGCARVGLNQSIQTSSDIVFWSVHRVGGTNNESSKLGGIDRSNADAKLWVNTEGPGRLILNLDGYSKGTRTLQHSKPYCRSKYAHICAIQTVAADKDCEKHITED